jgi:hypothetical protein
MILKGKATISIDRNEILVDYEGDWTKGMVDAAHYAMLKELRAYILKRHKEQSEKPKKKGNEK